LYTAAIQVAKPTQPETLFYLGKVPKTIDVQAHSQTHYRSNCY
jgi:hypothetical protein